MGGPHSGLLFSTPQHLINFLSSGAQVLPQITRQTSCIGGGFYY